MIKVVGKYSWKISDNIIVKSNNYRIKTVVFFSRIFCKQIEINSNFSWIT